LKKPLRGIKHFENTGLTGLPVIQEKGQETLTQHWRGVVRPCPGAIQTIAASSANGCVGDRASRNDCGYVLYREVDEDF